VTGRQPEGETATDFRIVPLSRDLDRAAFDCGVPHMNEYLQRYALQNEENHLTRTRVALAPDSGQVAGFYTTGWATVTFQEIPERGLPKKYPFHVGLLVQLAVDVRSQGRGLGSLLLLDVLARFELADRINPIPAVVLDLREEALRPFYEKFGFVSCGSSAPQRMYLLMKTIIKMNLSEDATAL
jgi:GNAT superfamily N-acetyltransferase